MDEYMFYVEEYFKKREAERLLMRRKHVSMLHLP
ncbi:unnamed protein product [Dibothriocephalus latus]|uniref:Uncharacterized protein n=1 Tax=Dibothriocephalus latus TaxID=60516 RepID=A0A3P7Q1N7_DIBLA|nr:unnamed protein product [Dibothriocephalus latus]